MGTAPPSGPGPWAGSHPAYPRCPASTDGIAGLVAAPAASTRPPISRTGRSLAPYPRMYDRGLKVMHLRLHGIALVCIPWWPPPRPVSSAWRTGFPSSLRVSGCDKLHPGMYFPRRAHSVPYRLIRRSPPASGEAQGPVLPPTFAGAIGRIRAASRPPALIASDATRAACRTPGPRCSMSAPVASGTRRPAVTSSAPSSLRSSATACDS